MRAGRVNRVPVKAGGQLVWWEAPFFILPAISRGRKELGVSLARAPYEKIFAE